MKKNLQRTLTLTVIIAMLTTALTGCQSTANETDTQTNQTAQTDSGTEDIKQQEPVYPLLFKYDPINTEFNVNTAPLPFSAPEFTLDKITHYFPIGENTKYHYKNVSADMLRQYVTELEGEGFCSKVFADGTAMLYREDCIIDFSGYDLIKGPRDITMTYYVKSKNTPDGAIDAQKAKDLIERSGKSYDQSFSPIDVTPTALYESSGVQIFAQAESSSSNHAIYLYLIYNGIEARACYHEVAVADVDNNGKPESWMIANGITSGMYTFRLIAWEGDTLKYYKLYYSSLLHPTFTESGDNLTLDIQVYEDGKFSGRYLTFLINADGTALELECISADAESGTTFLYSPTT